MEIPQIISQRVQLKTSLDNIVQKIVQIYRLGKIVNCERFEKGYEELNLKITTNKGIFVAKIFSRTRSKEKISDYITGLIEFSKANIPVPKLISAGESFIQNIHESYVCVMDYFEGTSFTQKNPNINDIKEIVQILAKIHKLNFKIKPNYDPWGTANLPAEFKIKSKYLNQKDLKLVQPIVDRFLLIDFSKLKKSIIHGDLQKQHVLKNQKGDYCILDLGCMDYNATIIDLAVFAAQFGLNTADVLKTYLKFNNLSAQEISFLPLLIEATFAVYLIQSNYLISTNKDRSSQTQKWLKQDRLALKKPGEIHPQY
jgi:Ser/Thr protein kinase RdoA (MazF antagonist)